MGTPLLGIVGVSTQHWPCPVEEKGPATLAQMIWSPSRTILQRCPMPRILKEPDGWALSILR